MRFSCEFFVVVSTKIYLPVDVVSNPDARIPPAYANPLMLRGDPERRTGACDFEYIFYDDDEDSLSRWTDGEALHSPTSARAL